MVFSERLKGLRLAHEPPLSQAALALALNEIGCLISKSSINMYERGEREPGFETLKAIAAFFRVDMNYLMGWTDTPNEARNPEQNLGNECLDSIHFSIQDTDPQIDRILRLAGALNAQGLEKLGDYAEDLTRIQAYQKHPCPEQAGASNFDRRAFPDGIDLPGR